MRRLTPVRCPPRERPTTEMRLSSKNWMQKRNSFAFSLENGMLTKIRSEKDVANRRQVYSATTSPRQTIELTSLFEMEISKEMLNFVSLLLVVAIAEQKIEQINVRLIDEMFLDGLQFVLKQSIPISNETDVPREFLFVKTNLFAVNEFVLQFVVHLFYLTLHLTQFILLATKQIDEFIGEHRNQRSIDFLRSTFLPISLFDVHRSFFFH